MDFEWDENKNASNQKKHGISFEEAKDDFKDDLYKKMPKEKLKIILVKLSNNEITWLDISVIEKIGIEIPEEIEIMADNNIAFDEDNIPITDEDIKSGKIKPIENTAKL